MLKRHLDSVLNFVLFPITNAVAEEFNSKSNPSRPMPEGSVTSSTTASESSSSAEDLTSSPLCNPPKYAQRTGRTQSILASVES